MKEVHLLTKAVRRVVVAISTLLRPCCSRYELVPYVLHTKSILCSLLAIVLKKSTNIELVITTTLHTSLQRGVVFRK